MKLDLSTIIGLCGGAGLVLMGMLLASGGDIDVLVGMYINQPSSLAIALGGSIGGVIASFPFSKLKQITKIFSKAVLKDPKNTSYEELINQLVEYASEARRKGVLALDAKTEEMDDEFIRDGIQLAVDGTAPEQIKEIMNLELEVLEQRHEDNQAILLKWAELAPRLRDDRDFDWPCGYACESSDPDAIGPSMALALITTLYGSMAANMICIPLANKLSMRSKEEVIRKEMIISAILAIQNGDNPRIVKQKLLTYVTREVRQLVNIAQGES